MSAATATVIDLTWSDNDTDSDSGVLTESLKSLSVESLKPVVDKPVRDAMTRILRADKVTLAWYGTEELTILVPLRCRKKEAQGGTTSATR